MQFSCNQDTFAKYLNAVSRVVSTKPGLPILNNILFEAKNGKVNMTVTDLEISMNTWIGAEVKVDGKVTVPAKQLSEFINSVPSEKIDVNLEKHILQVDAINNSAQFNTIPADDYPSVVSIEDEEPLLQITQEQILKAVNRVAFSAANEDIKPVMTGIKMEIKEESIAFVATNGLRLSRQVIKLIEPVSNPMEILVPAKAFEELANIVSEFSSENSNNTVKLYVIEDRNQVVFRFNDIDLVSRLIDGKYPAYQQVIPTGYKTRSEIKKSEFQSALKIVNIIARSAINNKIVISQDAANDSIVLSAAQAEVGSNESTFEAQIEGSDIKMAFGAKFIGDMLSHLDGETIIYESNSDVAPGVFKIKDDDTFLHLVMPMRL